MVYQFTHWYDQLVWIYCVQNEDGTRHINYKKTKNKYANDKNRTSFKNLEFSL